MDCGLAVQKRLKTLLYANLLLQKKIYSGMNYVKKYLNA